MRAANGNCGAQDIEITVNTQLIATLVAVVGIGVVVIIAIIVAHIAQVRRTGKMPTRDEFNGLTERVGSLEVVVATTNARIDTVIDTMNTQFEAVNARIDGLPTQESIDAAIRASEARIIKALVNHIHPESAGPPVFTEPL